MTLQAANYPRQSNNYQESVLDGELILYSATSEQAVYLNESSRLIWSLCNGVNSITEIINILSQAYPDAGQAIEQEVYGAIELMHSNGALLINDSPSSSPLVERK